MTQPEATVLAALIVILGGAASYAFQKWIDRREADQREFRDRLHAYFETSREAETHIFEAQGDVDLKVVAKYEAAFYSLRVLAPPEIVPKLDEHRRQVGKWNNKVRSKASDEELNAADLALKARMNDLEAVARKVMNTGRSIDPYKPADPRIREDTEK